MKNVVYVFNRNNKVQLPDNILLTVKADRQFVLVTSVYVEYLFIMNKRLTNQCTNMAPDRME